MLTRAASAFCVAVTVCLVSASTRAEAPGLRVAPSEVRLNGNFSQAQLLVTRTNENGEVSDRSEDLTSLARYSSSDDAIAVVQPNGRILPVANGATRITIEAEGMAHEVPVTVEGMVEQPGVAFVTDVLPVLNKAGCNMGACHAAQYGQGGFKLSVFGFDPDADREAIVRDRHQRRVNLIEPQKSLFLQKPSMQVAHGGGRRLDKDSRDYELLAAWLKSGAPGPVKEPPVVTELKLAPMQRVGDIGLKQQLRVEAVYSDGSVRDVTAWARYDSLDDGVLAVSEQGLAETIGKGQAPLMVRYEGQAAIALFMVPYTESVPLAGWQNNNFVDELASAKFRELGIEPSPLSDDATFLRRAFLDSVGGLPSVEETKAFLESDDPEKRTKLIDRLLGLTGDPQQDVYNDRYAAYWTLKWSDLIRNNSRDLGDQGMWALHNWIKESFRTNRPMDQFVRELVSATGSIYSNGPANYYRLNTNAPDLAEATAQLFLGVRLQCAKCHHHPFEKYGQEDYYGFAAFFARVGTKNSQEFGLFGREQVVVVRSGGEVRHPRTNQVLPPKALDGPAADHPLDRRLALADWLVAPENEYFARSIVNRYVAYLLGRGLVEPIDDLRATNPPSNPQLMDALAYEFVKDGFNLKRLMRTIMTSRLYQLDSQPTPENVSDRKFYSHYLVKRLPAEPLLDAIDATTKSPTKFQNLPLGTAAVELPDAEYANYFLTTFAKPRRTSVCECERSPDESLAQALHTLNGDILANKIADKNGRVAKLLGEKKPHEEIVNELYLAALCRYPTAEEVKASHTFLAGSPGPKECYEDLLWALINSKQFLFVR